MVIDIDKNSWKRAGRLNCFLLMIGGDMFIYVLIQTSAKLNEVPSINVNATIPRRMPQIFVAHTRHVGRRGVHVGHSTHDWISMTDMRSVRWQVAGRSCWILNG